jgi:hypothetical protein
MKRRRFFRTLAAVPAAGALVAQQEQRPATAPPGQAVSTELPKLETASSDAAAEMVPHFFDAPQFAALRKLGDILQPFLNGVPGALDAKAPEFLDFLIGESPADRQQLYRRGLDALNASAKTRYSKPFAELDATQAASVLAPLREPWTYDPPADPLARFLRAAKQDIRTATANSREYNVAGAAEGGGRRFGAQSLYWLPLD